MTVILNYFIIIYAQLFIQVKRYKICFLSFSFFLLSNWMRYPSVIFLLSSKTLKIAAGDIKLNKKKRRKRKIGGK